MFYKDFRQRISLNQQTIKYLLSALAGVAISLFGISLVVSFFTPVYYDDIGWMLSNARAGYDKWYAINPNPLCENAFNISVSWTLIPGRWIAWKIHTITENFLIMRFIALMILLGWMGSAVWLIKKVFLPQLSWLSAWGLTTAIVGMGITPLLAMQSRPETALLLAITWYVALPFLFKDNKNMPTALKMLSLCGFLLMTSWFFSDHPKALLYLPLVLMSCCYLPFRKNWPRALTGIAVLFVATQAFYYWQARIACPGDVNEQNFRNWYALTPDQLLANPTDFLQKFSNNVLNSDRYITHILFKSAPDNTDWTAPIYNHWWMGYINWPIVITAVIFIAGIVIGIVWQFFTLPLGAEWKQPRITIFMSLTLSLLIQSGIQIHKYFYESAIVWLCLGLLAGLAAMNRPWLMLQKKGLPSILGWVLGLSIASQLAFVSAYIPAITNILNNATPNGAVAHQPIILSPVQDIGKRTLALAKRCGINADDSSQHVLVDIATYLPLRETYQPIYGAYIIDALHNSKENIFHFLQKWNSSGIVTLCSSLPSDVGSVAIQENGLCCISRQNLILSLSPQPQ